MIFVLSILAGSFAVIAWTINCILKRKASYWTDRGVPMPQTSSLLSRVIAGDYSLHRTDTEMYKQLKSKGFGGYMELGSPIFFLTDLELIKRIFIKDFDHFVDRRSLQVEKQDPHFHLSLVNQTGERWRDLRSRMSPTFTTGRIRRMFNIFDSSSKKMVKCIRDQLLVNSEIELRPMMVDLSMDIIASAAFGIDTNLFQNRNSFFVKIQKDIQQTFAGRNMFKFFLIAKFPMLAEKLKLAVTVPDADRYISKLVIDTLNHREEAKINRDDFLQLMLEAKKGNLQAEDESQLDAHEKDAKLSNVPVDSKIAFEDDVIIAQSMSFFLGGFDTVEGVLTFATYELGINAGVQETLYEELKTAVDENDGEFSYDIVNNLEYLNMVISETMRLYTVSARTARKCTKAYEVPGTDVTLEKDMLVIIPSYAIHHDPEYYPNPEKFDPLRFTKENISKRHPFTYQPFGHGPRNCIGSRFALTEVKVAIAQLILNFKLEPCEKTVIPMVFANQTLIKPRDNICLKVTSRH